MRFSLFLCLLTSCQSASVELIEYAKSQQQNVEKYHRLHMEQEKALRDIKEESKKRDEELLTLRKALNSLKEDRVKNADLEQSIDGVVKLMALRDPAIQSKICELMALLGGEKCEKELVRQFSSSRNDSVRRSALMALKKMHSTELANLAYEVVLDSSQLMGMRRLSSEVLVDVAKEEMLPNLLKIAEILQGDSNYQARSTCQALYKIFARLAKEEHCDQLFNLLPGGDESGAVYIVEAILRAKKYSPKVMRELLQGNLSKDRFSEKHLRRMAEAGLDQRVTPGLLSILKSRNYRIRKACIEFLGLLKDPLAAEALIACRDKENYSDVKKVLKTVLKRYPGIIHDQDGKAILESAEELEMLIKERDKRVKSLK